MGDAGADDAPPTDDLSSSTDGAPTADSAASLSCAGKLARVVLENRGPLSPTELATEAGLDPERAAAALAELADASLAGPVCGVCDSREEVYALTADGGPEAGDDVSGGD